MKIRLIAIALVIACIAISNSAYSETNNDGDRFKQRPAAKAANPSHSMMLGASRAGKRIVAVGDRGVILLSDDDGKTFRQATSVPTRATLTAVQFVDEQLGWAVGHWGVILFTEDAGENWKIQRDDTSVDQPLFSLWFRDRNNGLAAGLFSLLLRTTDGGKNWQPLQLPSLSGSKASDINLFSIFSDGHGGVMISGEQGRVFHQREGSDKWNILNTGGRGTLWAGLTIDNGTIFVAGLRGNFFQSVDGGKSWASISTSLTSSITDIYQMPSGQIIAVGLDGMVMVSDDKGASFKVKQRKDQTALTAVISNSRGATLMFSQSGVIAGE